jgi:hypothetical protein
MLNMRKVFPLRVVRPDRICWGCARLCPASHMACGNGKERTEHPSELFGDDWFETAPQHPSFAQAHAADGGDELVEPSSDEHDSMPALDR